jgi:hypothetical protein
MNSLSAAPAAATRRAATARSAAVAGEQAWLTTILRPAGSLDQAAVGRLATLGRLTAASDMIVVDLTAADVRDPRALATALREPAAEFERAGGCLLVIGVSPALAAELDRAAVPALSLAGDAMPALR